MSRHHMAVCTVRGPALAGRGSKQHGGFPLSFAFSWLAPQPVYVCKSMVPTDRWGESLSAAKLLCTGMVYTGANLCTGMVYTGASLSCTGMVYTGPLLAGRGAGLVVGLLARDGLNRAGEGETRGLDGVECVVAIGLHTAGREVGWSV